MGGGEKGGRGGEQNNGRSEAKIGRKMEEARKLEGRLRGGKEEGK